MVPFTVRTSRGTFGFSEQNDEFDLRSIEMNGGANMKQVQNTCIWVSGGNFSLVINVGNV